jgi:hypothetical protein
VQPPPGLPSGLLCDIFLISKLISRSEVEMGTKEAQINLRLPADLDEWVEGHAGSKRGKPGFIREVLQRERAREEEEHLRRMFDAAWDSLSDAERAGIREERDALLGGYAGGAGS